MCGGEEGMERAKSKVREAVVSFLLQEKRRCLEALEQGVSLNLGDSRVCKGRPPTDPFICTAGERRVGLKTEAEGQRGKASTGGQQFPFGPCFPCISPSLDPIPFCPHPEC